MRERSHKEWKEILLDRGLDIWSMDKNPIVIVEGPDGGGKTTVLNMLLEIMKHTFLLHTSAPKKGSLPDYYVEVLEKAVDLVKVMEQPIAMDRFHIGEAVYGKLYRNYEVSYETLDNELKRLGAKHVYISASTTVLKERLESRGDWYVDPEDVSKIDALYREEMKKSSLDCLYVDTSNDLTEEMVIEIIRYLYTIS